MSVSIGEMVGTVIDNVWVQKVLQALLAAAIGYTYARFRDRFFFRNLGFLHIHIQPAPLHANDWHERYDNALGIFIKNAGTTNVYISRAFFRTHWNRYGMFRCETGLAVFPDAFRSADHDAYELKFGQQWKVLDVMLKPNEEAFTYLPLAEVVDRKIIKERRCGAVILEYYNSGTIGRHRVRV